MSIKGNNVECAECGNKLGKFASAETNCGCGAVVAGNVLMLNTADFCYGCRVSNPLM